jgi:hypothetical protein
MTTSYTTLNGETKPFKVYIKTLKKNSHIAIMSLNNGNYNTLVSTFVAKSVIIGKSPKCALTAAGTFGPSFDGNTILLYIGSAQYVYIGAEIIKFTSFGAIREFISPVGPENVAYPYAVDDKNNTYLFNGHVVLMNLSSTDYTNPYDYYEDHRTIVGTKTSKKPKHTVKLSLDDETDRQVLELYVVDDKIPIKYEPAFTRLYNDLTQNGKDMMYIVFTDDPEKLVSIDIDDFKKLMYEFGNCAQFRSFKRVVNI